MNKTKKILLIGCCLLSNVFALKIDLTAFNKNANDLKLLMWGYTTVDYPHVISANSEMEKIIFDSASKPLFTQGQENRVRRAPIHIDFFLVPSGTEVQSGGIKKVKTSFVLSEFVGQTEEDVDLNLEVDKNGNYAIHVNGDEVATGQIPFPKKDPSLYRKQMFELKSKHENETNLSSRQNNNHQDYKSLLLKFVNNSSLDIIIKPTTGSEIRLNPKSERNFEYPLYSGLKAKEELYVKLNSSKYLIQKALPKKYGFHVESCKHNRIELPSAKDKIDTAELHIRENGSYVFYHGNDFVAQGNLIVYYPDVDFPNYLSMSQRQQEEHIDDMKMGGN